MSSSNSQVESPVLRSQMTLTRLTVFPRRSSTLLSSRAMGGTSTVRSSLSVYPQLPTRGPDQIHTSSAVTHGTLDEGSPITEVKIYHKPPVQSFS